MNSKTIEFNFRTGVNAKDYSTVAKKGNLKPLEVELRRLEDLTASIHEEMLFLKEREQEMRVTNGSFDILFITSPFFPLVSTLRSPI